MYYLRFIFFVVAIFELSDRSVGQTPLKIGDTLSDIKVRIHSGLKTEDVYLKEFRGEALVFVFWGVNCTNCIYDMPRLVSLQREFVGKVKFILVTSDDENQVEDLKMHLYHYGDTVGIKSAFSQLLFLDRDTLLKKLFPYRVYGVEAWIDKDGVYKDLVYGNSVTSTNVERFLLGTKTQFARAIISNDNYGRFSYWQRYFPRGFLGSFVLNRIEYGEGENSDFSCVVDSMFGKRSFLVALNAPILELYWRTFSREFNVSDPPESRMRVFLIDSSKFRKPRQDSAFYSWADANTFCYIARFPFLDKKSIYSKMRLDLDTYFGLKSSISTIPVSCLVLRRKTRFRTAKPLGRVSRAYFDNTKTRGKLVIQNESFPVFVSFLERYRDLRYPTLPVVVDSKFHGQVDVIMNWELDLNKLSLFDLRRSLRTYGFDISIEKRNLLMLCIREDESVK